ncbi:MAG: hypothetical protein A2048_04360 [Deltaproteobacteria bacterium GWA2_45_12]|nr:MAG: hypothetical protein A2048_04360 [Deltaproteobacteria bacterium GWA2_45_12]
MPNALHEALRLLFTGSWTDVCLVGGTALAGVYAEHRRSDDIDLFATTPSSFTAMVRQTAGLKKQGAVFSQELSTPHYFHAAVDFKKHRFTLDIVLDENLKNLGEPFVTEEGIPVARLETLFCMKVACLVSRCSEKDLFDLDWIFSKIGFVDVATLIECGRKIDAGVTAESMLISLNGTLLKKEACHFALPETGVTVEEAHKRVSKLQKKLIHDFGEFEKKEKPLSEIQSLKDMASIQKKISK